VFSIEEHVSSMLYGLHGYVDIIFEGQMLDIDEDPTENSDKTTKILFEIKTGKPKHDHKNQVKQILDGLSEGVYVFIKLFWD
jgi:hypothetical protein